MISLGLFVLGLFLTLLFGLALLFKLFDTYIKLQTYLAGKEDNFSYVMNPTGLAVLFTTGLSLIYLFADAAKTYVMLTVSL